MIAATDDTTVQQTALSKQTLLGRVPGSCLIYLMRILYLSPRQCWPPVGGSKLRDFHLARALGQNAELTYVYFKGEKGIPSEEFPFCRNLIAINKPKPYTPGKIFRGLISRTPLTLINYSSPEMAAAVTELTRNSRFDLVHLDCIQTLSYLKNLPDALRRRAVVNWHNIESEILRRYAVNTPSLAKKFYALATARRLESLERDALRTTLAHVVCSDRERQLLLEWAPDALIEVVENGVDTRAFHSQANSPRSRVLFVGLMGYHANSDAAVWFAERVWPAIHESFPHWTMTIVGSDPTPQVRALAARSGIEVTGTVPDVKPYYNQAIFSVVPLMTGGGTRLKILEALAAGVPVISTSVGTEGLAVTHGNEVLIADHEADWLPACSSLADQGELWRNLVAAGRRLVETRYDWDILGQSLVALCRKWASA